VSACVVVLTDVVPEGEETLSAVLETSEATVVVLAAVAVSESPVAVVAASLASTIELPVEVRVEVALAVWEEPAVTASITEVAPGGTRKESDQWLSLDLTSQELICSSCWPPF